MASFEQRTLGTPGQNAQRRLMQQEGVDLLQPGGFAKRDAIRQAVSEDTQTQKRKSRAANLAYRQAVRQGDRKGALGILLAADEAGIQFGGVRAAGRDQQRAAQELGERAATARDAEAQEGDVVRAEPGSALLQERQEFAQELAAAKASGDFDAGALRQRASDLKISPKAASTAWGRLAGPRRRQTPKEAVKERKQIQDIQSGETRSDAVLRLMQEKEEFFLNRTKMA